MGMVDNYLDPGKYDFDNMCVCDGDEACDCVYDPVLGRLVRKDHTFDVEQDEE